MSGELVLLLRILLAISLYLFLCLTLWMMWQELKQAGYRAVQPRVAPLRLEIHSGAADPFHRFFTQSELTLGRDPACELRFDDEAVSARHAQFSFHHGQWWVEDLHSTNGTKLNQGKLTTAAVLMNGDEVRCGQATLVVRLNTETPVRQATSVEEQND
jgi:pSer/pThr/pTyr-binding forkhead associated (FHA) protein